MCSQQSSEELSRSDLKQRLPQTLTIEPLVLKGSNITCIIPARLPKLTKTAASLEVHIPSPYGTSNTRYHCDLSGIHVLESLREQLSPTQSTSPHAQARSQSARCFTNQQTISTSRTLGPTRILPSHFLPVYLPSQPEPKKSPRKSVTAAGSAFSPPPGPFPFFRLKQPLPARCIVSNIVARRAFPLL